MIAPNINNAICDLKHDVLSEFPFVCDFRLHKNKAHRSVHDVVIVWL